MTYDALKLKDDELLDVLALCREHGAMVMVHAESHELVAWITRRLLSAERIAAKYHAVARPAIAEREAAHRAITFAECARLPTRRLLSRRLPTRRLPTRRLPPLSPAGDEVPTCAAVRRPTARCTRSRASPVTGAPPCEKKAASASGGGQCVRKKSSSHPRPAAALLPAPASTPLLPRLTGCHLRSSPRGRLCSAGCQRASCT